MTPWTCPRCNRPEFDRLPPCRCGWGSESQLLTGVAEHRANSIRFRAVNTRLDRMGSVAFPALLYDTEAGA